MVNPAPQPEPTRLALFIATMAGGGAEHAIARLADGLAERGYAVDLVLLRKDGPNLAQLAPDVQVIELGSRGVFSAIRALAVYLRRRRPAGLLAAMTYPNLMAVLARFWSRAPVQVVLSEQNQPSSFFDGRKLARLKVYAYYSLIYRWADEVTAVSDGVGDDLARVARLRRDRVKTVYNPVVSDELTRQAAEPVDHPWFEPGQPPVLLAIGRLEPQKDFATLLRAFSRVRQNRDTRLIILGDGQQRPALEQLRDELDLRQHVAMPGFAANPYAYLARSAMLVMSSAHEGLPTVLIEALACGTPVVSTDCPSGPHEILKGGELGPLVPVGDDAALAEAIERTLEKPIASDNLRQRGADFSIRQSLDHYEGLLVPEHRATVTRPEPADWTR